MAALAAAPPRASTLSQALQKAPQEGKSEKPLSARGRKGNNFVLLDERRAKPQRSAQGYMKEMRQTSPTRSPSPGKQAKVATQPASFTPRPKGAIAMATAAEERRAGLFVQNGKSKAIDPRLTMDYINDYLYQNQLNVLQLVVSRPHEPRRSPDRHDTMSMHEMRELCRKIGLDLTVEDVAAVFDYIDGDNNGHIDVKEIEMALKSHKQGKLPRRSSARFEGGGHWSHARSPREDQFFSQPPAACPPNGRRSSSLGQSVSASNLPDTSKRASRAENMRQSVSTNDINKGRSLTVVQGGVTDKAFHAIRICQTSPQQLGQAAPRKSQAPAAMRPTIVKEAPRPSVTAGPRVTIAANAVKSAPPRPSQAAPQRRRSTVTELLAAARPDLPPFEGTGAAPEGILDIMLDTIKGLNYGIIEFFSHPDFNPFYTGTNEESVDTKALHEIFARAGVNLDPIALKSMILAASPDGKPRLLLTDLEALLCERRALRNSGMTDPQEEAKRHFFRSETQMADERGMQAAAMRDLFKGKISKPKAKRDNKEPLDGMEASMRLYKNAAEIEEKKRKLRETSIVQDLAGLDTVGREAVNKGRVETDRHLLLYSDAFERKERLEMDMLAARAAERLVLSAEHAHDSTDTAEERAQRIEGLHEDHQRLLDKRKAALEEVQKSEQARIEQTIQREREEQKNQKKALGVNVDHSNISSKWAEPKVTPAPNIEHTPAPAKPVLGANALPIEAVDHVLGSLNSAVSLRCGRAPEDADGGKLKELSFPLRKILEAFRAAHSVGGSAKNSDEIRKIQAEPSWSAWDGYHLRPDADGWKTMRLPDPIHQLYESPGEMIQMATIAQELLLSAVAYGDSPPQTAGNQKMSLRWPVGSMWSKPRLCPRASFGYNPGSKSPERVRSKSWVRYAPSAESHVKYVTDIARVALIFEDAPKLRGGLEDILNSCEVIDVRNYYSPAYQNLMGDRYVEVLVTVKNDNSALRLPFIAEIRLEEKCYFEARQKIEPELASVRKAFSEMYGNLEGMDALAVEYLAEHTLRKPKEPHGLTVFRRQLSRKYGSTVVAWRSALGNRKNTDFQSFKEACYSVNCRDRMSEYWFHLDNTRGGSISLFDLDPEAVIMLGNLRWRLLDFMGAEEATVSGQAMFSWLTEGVSLHTKGQISKLELRNLLAPLSVEPQQADTIFSYLDSAGGTRNCTTTFLTSRDFGWLLSLPTMVNLRAAGLALPTGAPDLRHFRAIRSTGRGRSPFPSTLHGRHTCNGRARTSSPPREILRAGSRCLSPNILKMVLDLSTDKPLGVTDTPNPALTNSATEEAAPAKRKSSVRATPAAAAPEPAPAAAAGKRASRASVAPASPAPAPVPEEPAKAEEEDDAEEEEEVEGEEVEEEEAEEEEEAGEEEEEDFGEDDSF